LSREVLAGWRFKRGAAHARPQRDFGLDNELDVLLAKVGVVTTALWRAFNRFTWNPVTID
jgi:hypothetical protein